MKRLLIVLLLLSACAASVSSQTGQGFWYPRRITPHGGPTFSGPWSLSGTTRQRVAFVMQCPMDGTLDQVEFYIGFVSAPSSMRVSFQDVDASDTPDGTQDQYRDVASPTVGWTVPGLMTSDGTDGGSKRTCTKGVKFAVVFEWTSTQSGEVWFYGMSDGSNTLLAWPPSWVHNGTSYAVANVASLFYNIALKYNDGTYPPMPRAWPASAATTFTSVSTSTTPDEIGNLFTVAVPLSVDGACVRAGLTGAFDFVIYNASDTELVSVPVPASTDGGTEVCVAFDDLALAATDYRAVVQPTTTTSLTLWYGTVNASAHRFALPLGVGQWTARTDGGSWSQTATQQVEIVLHISSVSGGGGSYPFISGLEYPDGR